MIFTKKIIVIFIVLFSILSISRSADEPTTGIQLGDTLIPIGPFPSHIANKGFGGWHTTTNIPSYMLTPGMAGYTNGYLYVYSTNNTWDLFVNGSTTNLASIVYVDQATQGLVTVSVTNGVVQWALLNFYPSNNPNGFVTQTITNGILSAANSFTTNYVTNISLIATFSSNGVVSVSNMLDSATNRIYVLESRTNGWNQASINATFASNGVVTLNGLSNGWNSGTINATWSSNGVVLLYGLTSGWNNASINATWASNGVVTLNGLTSGWNQASLNAIWSSNAVVVIQGRTSVWESALQPSATNGMVTNGSSPIFYTLSFTNLNTDGTNAIRAAQTTGGGGDVFKGSNNVFTLTNTMPALIVVTLGVTNFDSSGTSAVISAILPNTNVFTGSTNIFKTITVTNIIQNTLTTNKFAGNIEFTTVSPINSFITADGTGLTFQVLGDQYGTVKLHLQNRNGVNGVMFEQAGTVDLVDFVFKGTNTQKNIRYENRPTNKYLSATTNYGEFQFGNPNSPAFVVGETNVSVRLGYLGVGTNLPGSRLHVVGTMLATGLNITTNNGTNVATGFVLWTNGTGSVGPSPMFSTITATNPVGTNSFAGMTVMSNLNFTGMMNGVVDIDSAGDVLVGTNSFVEIYSGFTAQSNRTIQLYDGRPSVGGQTTTNRFLAFMNLGNYITNNNTSIGGINFFNGALGSAEKRTAMILGQTEATNSGNLRFYTYTNSAATLGMTIDSQGVISGNGKGVTNITQTSFPLFTVYLYTNYPISSPGVTTMIPWTNVLYDTHSGFNTGTYMYTLPDQYPGYYMVYSQARSGTISSNRWNTSVFAVDQNNTTSTIGTCTINAFDMNLIASTMATYVRYTGGVFKIFSTVTSANVTNLIQGYQNNTTWPTYMNIQYIRGL